MVAGESVASVSYLVPIGAALIAVPLLAQSWLRAFAAAERDDGKKREFRALNRRLVHSLALVLIAIAALVVIFSLFGAPGKDGVLLAIVPLLVLLFLVFDLLRTGLAIQRIR
jgi:mannose/fructose/N-acetylgalactosamine-specific phosphotransferase system component IIC